MKNAPRPPSRRSSRGLTLIEVVLLLVIVIVLAALSVLAQVGGCRRDRKADCKNSLRQIGAYFTLYESKFGSYPPIGKGPVSWFACIWRPDMATDGNLFRCAEVGKSGKGCHYWCLTSGGTWTSPTPELGGPPFHFDSASDLSNRGRPFDLPVACDQLGSPGNHPDGSVNVLDYQGRVDSFDADSPFMKSPPRFLGPSDWVAPEGTK